MARPTPLARRLAAAADATQRVLAQAGALSVEYDSARLVAALGHLAAAREELRQAALVAHATVVKGGR